MGTLVYAVEAWLLSIMGWAYLTLQEMWAWSLLSAHVFYGFIWLSTCNVIATGARPDGAGPRSAYFATVLAFALHSACCIFDTLVAPQVGPVAFESPFNRTACTLAKSQQLLYFSDSPFYLAQAGVTLGIGLGMSTPEDPDGDGFLRVAHMGHVNAHMTLGALAVMDAGLRALGIPHGPGALEAAAAVVAGR
jgi:hypothetical protein